MDLLPSLATSLADRYQLDRELGAGGMATVYLARDLRHDRDVAMKVLRPDASWTLSRIMRAAIYTWYSEYCTEDTRRRAYIAALPAPAVQRSP